jgi:glycosyltransferase involved in cell wall biosynthesis
MRNEDITVIEEERKRLVDFLGDTLVVVNSHQAGREWGFKNTKVIWQGFDPSEFPISTYAGEILTLNNMKARPHYRGYFLFKEIMEGFPVEHYPEETNVPIPEQYKYEAYEYSCAKYRNYIDTIRKYSIYLNPTYRSPMPRSRGEAMICGLVTVSAHNHDVDMFIRNTVNGFYSNDPAELREYLLFLVNNPQIARKIGNLGRSLALDIFNHDRYLMEWENIYKGLVKI